MTDMIISGDAPVMERPPIGFIGLGHMGRVMANRLIEAGYDVTVWSRTAAHTDDLVRRGATRGTSPEDAMATGMLFSMLSDESAVRAVCTPERLRGAPPGFIHVNHATISAEAAEEFSQAAAQQNQRYVAAPVIGRPDVAAAGNLTLLAAGAPEAVGAVMPMLESMGRRVWNYGPSPASANLAKISVNYLIIHALQALSESITLLERAGLDTRMFIETINDTIFPGPVYAGYGKAIVTSTYSPAGFTTVLGAKDLSLALAAAERAGVRLPTGPVLREVFEAAVAVGADLDWSAIAEITRHGRLGDDAPC